MSSGTVADAATPAARRRGRERTLELLYEAETKGIDLLALLEELPVRPEPYAEQLARGIAARLGEIDRRIEAAASGWALGRMPAVDRQLLRLGTFELLARSDVPLAVVIDEAVELAKAYSTEDSARFVNGVLATIAREARPGAAP